MSELKKLESTPETSTPVPVPIPAPAPTPVASRIHILATPKIRFGWLYKVIMLVAKVFSACILLTVCANLAPELREKMPSLYVIVDALLQFLEALCRILIWLAEKLQGLWT